MERIRDTPPRAASRPTTRPGRGGGAAPRGAADDRGGLVPASIDELGRRGRIGAATAKRELIDTVAHTLDVGD